MRLLSYHVASAKSVTRGEKENGKKSEVIAKEKEVKKGQGELGDGVWTENMEYKMGKIPIPTGRPTMVSWLAGLHPHGWLRGILDNYVWKREADQAGKTNPGSRQLSGWMKTREAILTTRAAYVVDIDLLSSVENKILSTPSAMGGGGSTKREGGKETKFSTGKSGRINSSGSEVDGIEGQAPPSLCPKGPKGGGGRMNRWTC
ncbi:hypothetical protein TRV_07244 [Trichophyton verrucosum HKI 0517]|uniref:Uncharacterized protein n=1 Tax=Trichophyton verrucosum (strain HKI 0517) TaxID=663202 RepID=D4DJ78_TRIVH|nr:uncharacterized protein TRV_07244 [Trichophyton verrucosum HKI 0517]EFE38094.1 hypothetical protein TRV_07244 [Trichophyton verrucosum HKI 0517]